MRCSKSFSEEPFGLSLVCLNSIHRCKVWDSGVVGKDLKAITLKIDITFQPTDISDGNIMTFKLKIVYSLLVWIVCTLSGGAKSFCSCRRVVSLSAPGCKVTLICVM